MRMFLKKFLPIEVTARLLGKDLAVESSERLLGHYHTGYVANNAQQDHEPLITPSDFRGPILH